MNPIEPAPGCATPLDGLEAVLAGLPVCPGVAIGPVFLTAEPPPQITRHRISAADAPGEKIGRAHV